VRSIFGWSLPPGCGRLPGEEPEPAQPRCNCGALLPYKPDRTEHVEVKAQCDGQIGEYDPLGLTPCYRTDTHEPHQFVTDCLTIAIWDCKRCKKEYRYTG